ncbi:APC family permease [Streptomyces lydicus]|nr:APC family permease [Streptomyces lydicus]
MPGTSGGTGGPGLAAGSPAAERAPRPAGRGSGALGALRRTLTFRDLVVYGLLFIAPMAPVGIFGTLQAASHGAVTTVYLVATVAMAFTAYSYAQMVRVAPQAGSVYTYARVGLGEGAGFVAGWMAMLDYLLIPAVAYLFSGNALYALVPSVHPWVWTALAVAVTTLLNLWGVRTAARVGFAVLAMEIVVLAVFVVSAVAELIAHGAARGWAEPLTGEGGFSVRAVLAAVSVAVLSYLGFDAIASFAEEAGAGGAWGTGGAGWLPGLLGPGWRAGRTGPGWRAGWPPGLTGWPRGRTRWPTGRTGPWWPSARTGWRRPGPGGAGGAGLSGGGRCAVRGADVPGGAADADERGGAGGPAGRAGRRLLRHGRRVGGRLAARSGGGEQGHRRGVRGAGGAGGGGRLLFAMARDRRLPGAMSKVDAGSGCRAGRCWARRWCRWWRRCGRPAGTTGSTSCRRS